MHEWTTYAGLALAATLAGVMNSVAGGGTLLTFPSLTAVLSPEMANATSTVALLPGSVAGAWGYRREVRQSKSIILLLLVPSLTGGILGALLVVIYPKAFGNLVPWLILTAAVLFLIQAPLGRWLKRNRTGDGHSRSWTVALVIFQFFVALYGGYFGAGIGILMLAALGIMGLGDIHKMNGVKTVLASLINTATVIVFALNGGMIHRDFAIIMAVSAILGGYFGARFARRLPKAVVQGIIIVIAFSLALYYFLRSPS
jgi:uncharacterized membrane protein YfcA